MAIFTGKDRSLIIEGHLIVIFNSWELFVSDLQGALWEVIHLQKRPSQGKLLRPSKPALQYSLPTCAHGSHRSACQLTQRCLTLFTSIRGKNLSTCSLKAVALISPCRSKREHIRTVLLGPCSQQWEQAILTVRQHPWSNSPSVKRPSQGCRHCRNPHIVTFFKLSALIKQDKLSHSLQL